MNKSSNIYRSRQEAKRIAITALADLIAKGEESQLMLYPLSGIKALENLGEKGARSLSLSFAVHGRTTLIAQLCY